jgi:hypothetical protein
MSKLLNISSLRLINGNLRSTCRLLNGCHQVDLKKQNPSRHFFSLSKNLELEKNNIQITARSINTTVSNLLAAKNKSEEAQLVQEKAIGSAENFEFLAETKQLLNIVAKSLYSEKEVFIRELISNSSDAIEKLKYAQLTSPSTGESGTSIPFEIHINANDLNNTLIIQVIYLHLV